MQCLARAVRSAPEDRILYLSLPVGFYVVLMAYYIFSLPEGAFLILLPIAILVFLSLLINSHDFNFVAVVAWTLIPTWFILLFQQFDLVGFWIPILEKIAIGMAIIPFREPIQIYYRRARTEHAPHLEDGQLTLRAQSVIFLALNVPIGVVFRYFTDPIIILGIIALTHIVLQRAFIILFRLVSWIDQVQHR